VTVPAHTTGTDPGVAPEPRASGGQPPVAVERATTAELVAAAVATWRSTLVEAAGGPSLVDIAMLGDASLDLSAAHPSGIAQLFAGRTTRLSNLVREGTALSTAKRRARAVGARAEEYAQRYGIAPTYLAIGVATWTERTSPDLATDDVGALAAVTRARPAADEPAAGQPAAGQSADQATATQPAERPSGHQAARTVRAPVLLRSVGLRARGSGASDYELSLEPLLELNPILARALRGRGALLDPVAIARGAFTGSGFDPRPALDRLAALGSAVLEHFTLTEQLLVGTFVHPGQVLVEDLDQNSATLDRHEVIAALAGDPASKELLARPLPERSAFDLHVLEPAKHLVRAPEVAERRLGLRLDGEQQRDAERESQHVAVRDEAGGCVRVEHEGELPEGREDQPNREVRLADRTIALEELPRERGGPQEDGCGEQAEEHANRSPVGRRAAQGAW